MRKLLTVLSAFLLAACGGGGGDAADPVGLSVNTAGQTYKECVLSVDGQISRHVIVGGKSPYSVQSLSRDLIVGTLSGNVFTPSVNGQFGSRDPLTVSNSGSSIWIVTDNMPCDSESIVEVRDLSKVVVNITINTEAAE